MKRVWMIGLSLGLPLSVAEIAMAEDRISGADAAYIDWATANCGLKSTDKEHRLADAANAGGGPAFKKGFDEEIRKFAALRTDQDRSETCSNVKSWYGPDGSRIPGLVQWSKSGPAVIVGKEPERR